MNRYSAFDGRSRGGASGSVRSNKHSLAGGRVVRWSKLKLRGMHCTLRCMWAPLIIRYMSTHLQFSLCLRLFEPGFDTPMFYPVARVILKRIFFKLVSVQCRNSTEEQVLLQNNACIQKWIGACKPLLNRWQVQRDSFGKCLRRQAVFSYTAGCLHLVVNSEWMCGFISNSFLWLC